MEAAYDCLHELPVQNLSLNQIARRADVARTTIHLAFGSRESFFRALTRDLFSRARFEDVLGALHETDARAALETWLRELVRFYAQEHTAHRALVSLMHMDPDAMTVLEDLIQLRISDCDALAQRLREQGYVRSQIRHAELVDLLWLTSDFDAFHSLFTVRQLTSEAVAERFTSIIGSAIGLDA
jgi:AcrR family transcriptional regulator